MNLLSVIKNLRKPKYEPLNTVTVFSKHLLHNLKVLQKQQPQAEIWPVLKSNAYGHGLKEVCEILEKSNIKKVCVDSFPEAQIVYNNSSKKVLVLGESPLDCYQYFNFSRTEFCVYNKSTFEKLASFKKQIQVHLFINTGMNREGIQDLEKFLEETKEAQKYIKIIGLCSHLASADSQSKLTKKQEIVFFKNLEIIKKYGIEPQYLHLGNSAGTFLLKNKQLNAFRAGISFYGYNVFPKTMKVEYEASAKLKPALRVESQIVSIQNLQKGEAVSYNETFVAEKDNTKIAVIPFGYFEGFDRRLSNRLQCNNKNKIIHLVGRVCMNLSCFNISETSFKIGDKVIIISENPKDPQSIDFLAQIEQTINYEVLVKLQANIRRKIC